MKWTDKVYQKITIAFGLITLTILIYNTVKGSNRDKEIHKTNQSIHSLTTQIQSISSSNKNSNESANDNSSQAVNNNSINIESSLTEKTQATFTEKITLPKEDYQVVKFDSLVKSFSYLVGQLDDRAHRFYFSSNFDSIQKEKKERTADSLSLHNHSILAQLEGIQDLIDLTALKLDSNYLNKALKMKTKLQELKKSRLY